MPASLLAALQPKSVGRRVGIYCRWGVETDSMCAIQSTALLDVVRGSTERLYSELIQYRPDLSYTPAAK